ncbi:MAG: carbohydrate binding family 9 domain-containing protein [Gemmatimonadaceae bacterium]|nr:carbohydrate binding family 9 domain-containing protein [Gemmatimonadaceae bacterium]
MNRLRLLALVAATLPAAVLAQLPRVQPSREPLKLDARLDEAAWARADSIDDFRQRDPVEGAPATERTVVRFVSAHDGLWIGIHAYDREPSRILHAQLRRDTELNTDDGVQVLLSPLQDKRTAFWFAVNPNGAMTDAEVLSFENENFDWDAVWDARARITEDGWVAELFIPWPTLRYRETSTTWDVNVLRVIRRKNEEVLWRAWRRPEGINFLERAGVVDGFTDLPPRARVELRPYASTTSTGVTRDYATDGRFDVSAPAGSKGAFGLDAKLAPSRGLTLDLTTNADFAQADVDRMVINLSRFPLFYPERRPFFTEGAGIFDFGRTEETQLFYSRRIGLSRDGEPIPLLAGARLSGRVGDQQIGVIAARTGGDDPTTDVVARVKRDLLGRGYLGAMFTGTDSRHGALATATGLDVNMPFIVRGQNLVFLAATAWTHDSAGGSPNYSRFAVDFPNDFADIVNRVERVEADFNPALGFVRSDGIVRYGGSFRLMPRPKIPLVRRLEFNLLNYQYVQRIGGGLDNAEFEVTPLGINFESGDEIQVNLQRSGDAPRESFEVFEGTVIPAGTYWYDRWNIEYDGSSRRPLRVEARADFGRFYQGRGEDYSVSLEGRWQPHLLWAVEFGYTDGRFPSSRFIAHTASARVDYALTPRLNTTFFAQWNNESNRGAVNARLRWTRTPGSDLYVVVNSAWPTGLDGRSIPWSRPQRGGVVVKYVQYLRY